jgi:putative endonuclease
VKLKHHQYFTYITTNPDKKVLYTGVSNNLPQRITEHYLNRGNAASFAGKYYCYNLVYFKSFQHVEDAISWEKRIKGWSRKKKDGLIVMENPGWEFLNENVMRWPPDKEVRKRNVIPE